MPGQRPTRRGNGACWSRPKAITRSLPRPPDPLAPNSIAALVGSKSWGRELLLRAGSSHATQRRGQEQASAGLSNETDTPLALTLKCTSSLIVRKEPSVPLMRTRSYEVVVNARLVLASATMNVSWPV